MVAPIKQSEWLTPAEIAAELHVDVATIRRNIHTDASTAPPEGKLQGIRIGRLLRVHIDDLRKHQARERQQRTAVAMKQLRGRSSAARVKDYLPNL